VLRCWLNNDATTRMPGSFHCLAAMREDLTPRELVVQIGTPMERARRLADSALRGLRARQLRNWRVSWGARRLFERQAIVDDVVISPQRSVRPGRA
jgi:hypothetical protein